MKLSRRLFVVIVIILTCCYAGQTAHAQGIMLRGVGAVNEAVGGTATAMPLDASGALFWNPASISALPKNEMTLGLELIQAHSRVNTSMGGNVIGSTKGKSGVTPVPSMGFVWSTSRRSPITYGIGLAGVGGATSLYPQDTGNPVLATHGRSANVIVLQMTPTVSVQLTERMSVGVAPIIDLASLNINPMSLGRPMADPLMTYGTKYVWGGGFQIGTLYDFQNHFKAGFMFKSPIWAEKLYFTGTDKSGDPGAVNFELNLPMTLSAGLSYDGFRNTVIGMDVRYFDYAHTAGFDKGLSRTGVVEGLDWESIFAISVGLERRIGDRLKGRLGYCWNEAPIPGRSAALSISAPLITEHVFSCGVGYTFARDLELSAAYCHAFEAKCTGPVPGAQIPLTVTNIVSADTFSAGLTKKW
jgi:long-chain fatty acid transport protein